jgi:hypothetical protein
MKDKAKIITIITLILLTYSGSLCWSFSEDALILKHVTFESTSQNYLIDFTLELYNNSDQSIESIDAFIIFQDKKGNILNKVYVKPNFKISPNNSCKKTWTYIMNPFCRMLKMKEGDIQARLLVREITFLTGEGMPLVAEKNVVY